MDHLQQTKKEYKNLKKQEIHDIFIKTNCFQHDMAYEYFKDLTRRTACDKILHDKAFNIAKNPKYHGYQRELSSMVYIFFDKQILGQTVKNENISIKELAEKLHKPVIRKFEKRKVHSPFIDNIWGADLADIQLVSKFNEGLRFLLCAIIFNAKLKQANLASKKDIANFAKKTDFDNKLKNFTWNKNELNKLSKIVKAISTKILTKDLINKFSILNGAKHFPSGIFQNYLAFIPAKK